MKQTSQEQVERTLAYLASTITNCSNAKAKTKEGTPQYSLLTSRIKALVIAKSVLEKAKEASHYSLEELEKALPPLLSILQKTTKAQSKYAKEDRAYKRLETILRAVRLAKEQIEEEIRKRKQG